MSNSGFISPKMKDQIERFKSKQENYMLFYYKPEHSMIRQERQELRDNRNLKWAYIWVGKSRKMLMVDKTTMIAYKMDGYNPTWMTWDNYKFERWCTPMDL